MRDQAFIAARKNIVSFLYFFLPILLVFSFRNLVGNQYTGWDTHDLNFVNLVYFRDCLRSGHIPLWNPFIQSGTFFPSLNNIGLFSFFELPFVAIAQIFSPLVVFEWLIQFTILLGGIGAYIFFRSSELDHNLACLGASLYAITSFIFNVGQLGFIFSLASLPWMLAASHALLEKKFSTLAWSILGILLGFSFASGYPWMNLMNTGIFLSYTAFNYRLHKHPVDARGGASRLLLFLFLFLSTYAILIAPGYLNLHFNYAHFFGDYINPEPRLRSLNAANLGSFLCPSLKQALKAIINTALLRGIPFWTFGAGWITSLLLAGAILKKPKLKPAYFYWIGLAAFGVLYARGLGARWLQHVPLFNANRWWFLGLDYSVIGLVILAFLWAQDAFGQAPLKLMGRTRIYFFGLIGLLSTYLLYQHIPWYEFTIIIGASAILASNKFFCARRSQIVSLAILGIPGFLIFQSRASLDHTHATKAYVQSLNHRKVSPVIIDKNDRRLGNTKFYDYQDTKWYIDKSPYSHGYDNLGSPIYWYIKNSPIVSHLFSINGRVREASAINRQDYRSDNNYVNAIVADILKTPGIPMINIPVPDWARETHVATSLNILHTELQPNAGTATVKTSGPALVIFNNNYAPGWRVFVNEKAVPLIKVDHIFMGAFIPAKGLYSVAFKFQPKSVIAALLIPYAALLALGLILLKRR